MFGAGQSGHVAEHNRLAGVTFPVSLYGSIHDAVSAAASSGGGTVVFAPGELVTITTPITLPSNVSLRGPSHRCENAGVQSSTVDLIRLGATATNVAIENLHLRSLSGGGHVINTQNNNMSRWLIRGCYLRQDNTAKSVLTTGTGDMVQVYVEDNYVRLSASATVPGFNCVSDANAINCNTWRHNRFENSGDYCIHIESTSGTGYCQDNTIADNLFQQCLGGEIRLLSVRSCNVDGVYAYDAPSAYTKSRVVIGASATGVDSRANRLSRVVRRGGSLDTGVKDIALTAGESAVTVIELCNGTIDLGSNSSPVVTALDPSSPAGTLENEPA